MDEKHLESRLKKLRASIDRMPTRTDKSVIMEKIHQKGRKRNYAKLMVFAGGIASLLIFSLLLITSFDKLNLNNPDKIEIVPAQEKPKQELELVDAKIEMHADEERVGSIGITHGEMEGEFIVPTVLSYEFIIKNNTDKTIGSMKGGTMDDNDFIPKHGLNIEIEPKKKFKEVSHEVLGFNLLNRQGPHGYGSGAVFKTILESNQEGGFYIDFTVGASTENPELPLIPSQEQLDKLEENAFYADLVVMINNKEITRFDLSRYIEDETIERE